MANDFQEIIRIVPFPTKMSGCEDSPNLDNLMDAHTHSLIACSSDKHKTTKGYPSSLISLLLLALDYVDSTNKIVAVGVNLLSPTHQNIVLFYKLVGAMLWNGYRGKNTKPIFYFKVQIVQFQQHQPGKNLL